MSACNHVAAWPGPAPPGLLRDTSSVKRLTAIFFQGLVAILPLAVTVVLLSWLGSSAERGLVAVIKRVLPDAWYLGGEGYVAVYLPYSYQIGEHGRRFGVRIPRTA